ncbi:MAG: hypothetical protein JWM50_1243 [Microbacteriaceae bacterium]|nr:hypothetical protein [Microbacteriaceae bacterium]
MPDTQVNKRPVTLAVFLIVAGVIGWYAAFALTIEKFATLSDPGSALTCDFSVVVQCSANLESWQGSLFGFPNPVIGLAAWIAPVVVGVALLAGARFARWFWIAFNVGVLAAMVFVVWLISQSIFDLGTLCIYCMLTWSVTIPLFLTLTLRNITAGVIPLGAAATGAARGLYSWLPALTLGCYIVVAVIAQLRLDVLATL